MIKNNDEGNNNEFEQDISASALNEHIERLKHKYDPNDPAFNGFDEEFNHIELRTAQEQFFGDYTSASLAANKTKNRYSNVLPPEGTRVKLEVVDGDESSDYINANYIHGLIPESNKAYIATQGPLTSTLHDFWRMVWELNVTVIVMLTKEVENGRLKCDRYWPESDCPLQLGNLRVILSEVEETSKDELIERKITLRNEEKQTERQIVHLQYIAWPDHGLPVSTTAFLSLIDEAYKYNTQNSPIVVHCSAGIGRSGTFCTVHATLEKLKLDLQRQPDKDPSINIVKAVLAARADRPGMVQTKEQYTFIYLAVLEKAREILQNHARKNNNQNNKHEEKSNTPVPKTEKESKPEAIQKNTEKL